MTQSDLNSFRNALLRLQSRIRGNVTHLTDEALSSSAGGSDGKSKNAHADQADQGSDQFDQDLSLLLLQNEEQTLEEIRDALARVDEGSFGICEECEKPVPKARLKALPYTRYCVKCAREIEQGI